MLTYKKVLLLGKSKAGKTQLLNLYLGGVFNDSYIKTRNVNCFYWDQMKFHELDSEYALSFYSDPFYENSYAAILVLDITEKFNKNDILDYIKKFRQKAGEDLPIVLVVNKTDLNTSDLYSQNLDSIKKFFNENKQKYNLVGDKLLEVSARNNTNVKNIFQTAKKSITENVSKKAEIVNALIYKLTNYKTSRSTAKNSHTFISKILSFHSFFINKDKIDDYLGLGRSITGFSKDEKIHSVDLFHAFLMREKQNPNTDDVELAKHFEYTKSVENTIKALTSNRLGKICKDFFKNKKQAQEFEKFLNEIFQLYKQPNNSTTLTNPR